MKILAFDTSTVTCSAAVWQDGEIIARHFEVMVRGQAEALVPMIGMVLEQAEISATALDLLAVTTGPGAFTGVRIGLATARSMALATNVPLIGISTFETLVHGLDESERLGRHIYCVVDTKRGDVFVQQFNQELQPLGDGYVASCEQVRDELSKRMQDVQGARGLRSTLVGSGVPLVMAECPPEMIPAIDVFDTQPQAVVVAKIAAGRGVPEQDTAPPGPIYLRPPEVRINPGGGRLRS